MVSKKSKLKNKSGRKLQKKAIKKITKKKLVDPMMSKLLMIMKPTNPTSTIDPALRSKLELNTSGIHGNLRQALLNNYAAHGPSIPAFPPQIDASSSQLRQIQESNEFQRRHNNEERQSMIIAKAETKAILDEKAQMVKDMNEWKRRAMDAEKLVVEAEEYKTKTEEYKAKTEKAKSKLVDVLARAQESKTKLDLQPLLTEAEDLQSLATYMDFQIRDMEAINNENKLGHKNAQMREELEAKKAKLNRLSELAESEDYKNSIETNAKLINENMLIEEQIKIKEQALANMHKNIELKSKLAAYPNSDQVDGLVKQYDKEVSNSNETVAAIEAELEELADKRAIVDMHRDLYKRTKKKEIETEAKMWEVSNVHDLMQAYANSISYKDDVAEIAKNTAIIDTLTDDVNAYSDKAKRKRNLANQNEDLKVEVQRIMKRKETLKNNDEQVGDDIERLTAEVAKNGVSIEDINRSIQESQNIRDTQSSLKRQQSEGNTKLSILTNKNKALINRNQELANEIETIGNNIARTDVETEQQQQLNETNKKLAKSKNDLAVAVAVGEFKKGPVYLGKQMDIAEKELQIQQNEIQRSLERQYQQAAEQFNENTVIRRFLDTCEKEGKDYRTYADRIGPTQLAEWGFPDPTQQTIILNMLQPDRERLAKERKYRQAVVAAAFDYVNSHDPTIKDTYVQQVDELRLPPIWQAEWMSMPNFYASRDAFANSIGVPDFFNNIHYGE